MYLFSPYASSYWGFFFCRNYSKFCSQIFCFWQVKRSLTKVGCPLEKGKWLWHWEAYKSLRLIVIIIIIMIIAIIIRSPLSSSLLIHANSWSSTIVVTNRQLSNLISLRSRHKHNSFAVTDTVHKFTEYLFWGPTLPKAQRTRGLSSAYQSLFKIWNKHQHFN